MAVCCLNKQDCITAADSFWSNEILDTGLTEDGTEENYFCGAEEDILQMELGLLEVQISTYLEWVALLVWFCLKAFVQFLRETVLIFANSKEKIMPLNIQHTACLMKIQEY